MRRRFHTLILVGIFVCSLPVRAVPKPHVISCGKWTAAKWYVGPQARALGVKIRALYLGTRLKERVLKNSFFISNHQNSGKKMSTRGASVAGWGLLTQSFLSTFLAVSSSNRHGLFYNRFDQQPLGNSRPLA